MIFPTPLVEASLLFLAILDSLLALWVFLAPDGFYRWFFAKDRPGNGDFLYRSGALWFTFSLLQFVAFFLWKTNPFWLLIIVGVRLSEWSADWILLLLEKDFTPPGATGFLVSSPFTVSFAAFFYLTFDSFIIHDPAMFFWTGYQPSVELLVGLLLVLVVLDTALATVALGFPDRWYDWVLTGESPSSTELLTRTGAVWGGFAILQIAVLIGWTRYPELLVILAGVRLTEVLADWVSLSITRNKTWSATVALSVSPPLNAVLAFVFYQGYLTAV